MLDPREARRINVRGVTSVKTFSDREKRGSADPSLDMSLK